MSGPMSGASTTNGASVSNRYAATRGRAAPIDTLKNNDPASETVKNASAAGLNAFVQAREANGGGPAMRRKTDMGTSGRCAETGVVVESPPHNAIDALTEREPC